MLASCEKCGESKDIRLHRETMKPTCTSCGHEQQNMNKFVVSNMLRNKEFITTAASGDVPFPNHCTTCAKTTELVYDAKQKKAVCSACGTVADVSKFVIKALESTKHVKRSNVEVSEEGQ